MDRDRIILRMPVKEGNQQIGLLIKPQAMHVQIELAQLRRLWRSHVRPGGTPGLFDRLIAIRLLVTSTMLGCMGTPGAALLHLLSPQRRRLRDPFVFSCGKPRRWLPEVRAR
jgi:hypothetical protein